MSEKWIVLFEGSVDKTFDTRNEAIEHAEKLIASCLDGEWNNVVEDIEIAEVVMVSTQVDLKKRPHDNELDADSIDADGNYWENDGYICNYKMQELRRTGQKRK